MSISIALPSKGRLKEKAIELFTRAGLELELPTDARSYTGAIHNVPGASEPVALQFLSASEIARELINGNLDAGVTGEDLARETIANADDYLTFALPLGFGHADVVIAIPESWVDVNSMADLDDVAAEFRARHGRRMHIATKYWQLTQNYFTDHGIAFYRIVESLGATEAAPAAGQADVIVDITSTGSTLRANALKMLSDGIILKSQANLIISRTVEKNPETKQVTDAIRHALDKVVTQG